MPQPFDFLPLNRVIAGAGVIARLGEVAKELGTRALLVTDPGLKEAGHPQRAFDILTQGGVWTTVYDQVRENPTNKQVQLGAQYAKEHGIDLIVAVGGGSSMDAAKGINFILTNGGHMKDYKGLGKATKPMLPSIGVPTTSGTGSEAQCYALITDESSHLKMACGDKKAAFRVAILDPELTLSQPKTVTAVTGIDAIAHAVESFVCTKRNPISQLYSLAAWQHLEGNFARVLEAPGDLESRAAMQMGAHFAGVAIENSMLGICHSCANPLTAHYGITHGAAIAMLLPHVIRFNAPAAGLLYGQLKLANGNSGPEALAARVGYLAQLAGLPGRLRDCHVSESILPLLAVEANEQWTARFNPRPVSEEDLLAVYRAAW